MTQGAINYQRYLDGNDDGIVEIIKEYKDVTECHYWYFLF